MELINTHCHSRMCGHGEGEIEEYAAAAEAAGLTTLAFTEHFPLSDATDPRHYVSVPWDEMDAYCAAVEDARRNHPKLDILLGVELDYLGDLEDREFSPATFTPYELILGSVHFVDGWPFDDPAQRDKWEEEGQADLIWRRYFELWMDAVSDPANPFQVMSHPDLAKKFNYYPSFDITPWYERAAEACAKAGRMIEVNTSGTYYACEEMFPSPAFLRAFREAGVPATVGTDAHTPSNVARDIMKAYAYLRDAGYDVVTVPTRSGDRREIPLIL